MIWREKNNRHTWAFIHYCRRQGDRVIVNYSCSCYPRKKFCGHPVILKLTRRE